MKNIILGLIAVFTLFSCNEIARKNSGSWQYIKEPTQDINTQAPPQEPIDLEEEKKYLIKLESILVQDFQLNFKGYYKNGNSWANKVQVPQKVNIKYLVQALDEYGERGERMLGLMGNTPEELKYKGELEIKVAAVKDFLDNHDRDQSFFIKPKEENPTTPPPKEREESANLPAYCTNLAGVYKEIGTDINGNLITITGDEDCKKFNFVTNNKNYQYEISVPQELKCNSFGSSTICSRSSKMSDDLITFIIQEKWGFSGCNQRNIITVDVNGGILNSSLTYRCNDSTKNYDKITEYHLINVP
jgi:hypothetical protein